MSRSSKTLPVNLPKIGERQRLKWKPIFVFPQSLGIPQPVRTVTTAAVAGCWKLCLLAGLILVAQPAPAWACAACYGASDSPMAKGMNWGIFTLLGVVGCVLSTFATFIVFLAKKSAAAADAPAGPSSEPTEKI